MIVDSNIAQTPVEDWMRRCFGEAVIADRRERALRVLEEAIELAQAENIEAELVSTMAFRVYERPKGRPLEEAGGVGVCLLAYCCALHERAEEVVWSEIRRILAKSPEHFAKRQAAKAEIGLGMQPAATAESASVGAEIQP